MTDSANHAAPIQGELRLHLWLHVAGDARVPVMALHRRSPSGPTSATAPAFVACSGPGIVDLEVGAEHQRGAPFIHHQAGGREIGLAGRPPIWDAPAGSAQFGQRPCPG